MSKATSSDAYRRRIAEAQARQAMWQAKIDDAPPGTSQHRLGVWRGKVRDWRQAEAAARARVDRLEGRMTKIDPPEAALPAWVGDDPAVRGLWANAQEWRAAIAAAEGDVAAQNRLRDFARRWREASQVITLAEAERRWHRVNLRQYPMDRPFRWQAADGRRTWLTTVAAMEEAFGPEPAGSAVLYFDLRGCAMLDVQEVDDTLLNRSYYLLAGNPAVRVVVRGGQIEQAVNRALAVKAGFEDCWGQWQANAHLRGRKTYLVTVFLSDERAAADAEPFSAWLHRNYLAGDAPYREAGGRYPQRPHGEV